MNEKSFEQFVEEVRQTLLSYLPPEFEGANIEVSTKTKVNRLATGLTVIPNGEEKAILPLVNLDGFYERYKNGMSMDEVMNQMSGCFKDAFESMDTLPFIDDPISEMKKENVYMQLINTKSNETLLENVPHREFHDMSIIYRVLMAKDDDGIQSVMITDDLAENLGLSEEELFELASVQTKELFPPRIDTMANVMMGFFNDSSVDMSDEMIEDLGLNDNFGMYLVTNDVAVSGATYMVYDDILYDVANRLGQNTYVLPSSIHEFLLVPESMGDPETLAEMVRDINRDTVGEVDRLSNQVFHYDKDLRELTQVSNTPILGIKDEEYRVASVAEPSLNDYSFEAPTEGKAR